MALAMTTLYRDVEVIDAYWRICSVTLSKSTMTCLVSASATPTSDALVVREYCCVYDIVGENPIHQAYLYLKTLPEFANAVDC